MYFIVFKNKAKILVCIWNPGRAVFYMYSFKEYRLTEA